MENTGLLSGTLMFLVLGVVGVFVTALTRRHREGLRFQRGLFVVAYSLRYAMSLAIYFPQVGLVNLLQDEDGSGWLVGVAYHEGWVRQDMGVLDLPYIMAQSYTVLHRGYYYMLGALYFFVEPARLPAAALNCFFGALTIVFAYRTARTLFSESVARRVGTWLTVFPSLIIWSAQTVKEPVVILLEVLVVYGCVHLNRGRVALRHIVLTVACIALLIPFRFYAAYLAVASVIISLVVANVGRRRGGFKVGPIFALAVVFTTLIFSGLLAGREAQFDTFDLEYISRYRHFAALEGSGVDVGGNLNAPEGLSLAVLVGAAHLLLAPFPWQLFGGSLRMMLVAPEMLFWWWLFFVGVVPGLFHSLRTRLRDILPLLVLLLGFGMLYSLMFGNVGLVYRQRAQLLPWLLTFGAVGLERRRDRRSRAGPVRAIPSVSWEAPELGMPDTRTLRAPDEPRGLPPPRPG